MKRIILIILTALVSFSSSARHLKGGWIFYQYLGKGSAPNTSKYRIVVNQYLSCGSTTGQIDLSIRLGIFEGSTSVSYTQLVVALTETEFEDKSSFSPCLTNAPAICYRIDKYETTIDLPDNNEGYTFAVQRCCRIETIVNLLDPGSEGVTYTVKIPGVVAGTVVRNNNSPVFAQEDTAVVCVHSPFTFNFGATDADGDSLEYVFCPGITGGSAIDPAPKIVGGPPYTAVKYFGGYSGGSPLGSQVKIDAQTGIISGISPSTAGTYVVAVCVYEFRNGIAIGQNRKEIHIDVADCDIPDANLNASYLTCDGFNLTFINKSTSTSVHSYYWEFGDPNSATDTSILATPTYTYTDSGSFPVKLVINRGEECADSTTTIAQVYPGFIPDFNPDGSCFTKPYNFIDLTTSKYGVVDSLRWDFGDMNSIADTSIKQNPVYSYPGPDTMDVRLIVTNSKGCLDTITKEVVVLDKALLTLPFTDTLICAKDSLQLQSTASPTATYSWYPATKINDPNISNPIVYPGVSTIYTVTIDDKGCTNTDSVTVNVIEKVALNMGNDTTICATDSVHLQPSTDGIKFSWAAVPGLTDTTILDPIVTPLTTTTYTLTSSVGGCKAKGSITITPVPYPQANAGADTGICFGNIVHLDANITASQFSWSPTNTLLNETTLTPTAGPQSTTSYILTVTDNQGCPKPVSDTVTVNVVPPVRAFAGNDTLIVFNQPLQLNASGGTIYTWSPATGMDNPNIANPIIILGSQYDSVTYRLVVSTPEGCSGTDYMTVTVYKTIPDIIVPGAFTPNGDGRNDKIKPLALGIKQFNYFRVFNRWGNLLFSTTVPEFGWDGTFGGAQQASGTYVYETQGVDYIGKVIHKKGTIVLIR